ncbi:MAG: NUDIX hydrolase [Vulcanimicrobiaceae bacterium]
MEKPLWRRRASVYVVDSKYLRLRKDDIELPDGTVIADYYVRESAGFVVIFALTADRQVVLVRQYRYGADSIGLELPAGSLEPGEDPLACAHRELAEETGYAAPSLRLIGRYRAEPVHSDAYAYVYLAENARLESNQRLDPTEQIEVELVALGSLQILLRQGAIDTGASIAAAYLGLEAISS